MTDREETRVAQVLDEYLAECRAGRAEGAEDLLRKHPDLADDLKDCLSCLNLVERGFRDLERGAGNAADALPGGMLGDFRIIREVGRGGMGVVYEAEQISLGRRVALKVLPFAAVFDDRQLQRFRNEAQAAAFLHHTNIVPVHAVGHERGVHFYAMQFIEGRSLAEVVEELKRGPPVPSQPLSVITQGESTKSAEYCRAVARIGIQAAAALAHAHERGVVHRDVKPANLMVDPLGHLWVMDFGLANFRDGGTNLTMTGDVLGTVRYMSPEQAQGERGAIDHRTDVYSLGVTLCELLTLEPAFPGPTPQEVMRRIADGEYTRPRKINEAIPVDLETILSKAMAVDPVDRYASAGALAEDLERFLNRESILATRPSLLDVAGKWAVRHKPIVAAAVLVLLVTSAALGVTAYRIAEEQDTTEAALTRAETRRREAEDATARMRRSFDLANRAVDQMLAEVGSRALAGIPGMAVRRERILDRALAFYDELLAQQSGDESVLADVANVHARIGGIQVLLGRVDEAFASFARAREMLDGLGRTRDRLRVDSEEAKLLLVTGRLAEAGARFDAILDSWRDVAREAPSDFASRVALGTASIARGVIHQRLGDTVAAREAFTAARDAFAALSNRAPDDPAVTRSLAVAWLNLGRCLRLTGPLSDAEQALRKSLALAKRGDDPSVRARAARELAVHLEEIGLVEEAKELQGELLALRRDAWSTDTEPGVEADLVVELTRVGILGSLDRSDEAESALGEAIRRAERLVAAFPDYTEYKRALAEAHTRLAMHVMGFRWEESATHFRDALRLREELVRACPEDVEYRSALASAWSNMVTVHKREGSREKGVVAARAGIQQQEKLVHEHPDIREFRGLLAASWNNLAVVCPESEAGQAIRESIGHYEELHREYPEVVVYARDLVSILWNDAISHSRAGDARGTETACKRAVEVSAELANAHPRNADLLNAWVGSLIRLGYNRRQLRLSGAMDAFREAVDAAQALVAVAPTPMNHWEYACALDFLADGLEGDDARQTYREVVKILRPLGNRPEHCFAEQLGKTLSKLGRRFDDADSIENLRESIAWSRRTLHVAPDHRQRLASRLREFGFRISREDADAAEAAYRESIAEWGRLAESNPRFTGAACGVRIDLGILLMEMGRAELGGEEFQKAENGFAALDPPNVQGLVVAQRNLALALTSQGRLKEAIATYRRALAVRPDGAELNNALAWLLATAEPPELRDGEAAVRHARAALSVQPENKDFRNTLGAALLRAGRHKHAIRFIQDGVRNDLRDYNGFLLAVAHARLGNQAEARRCFEEAEAAMREREEPRADLVRLRRWAAATLRGDG